MPATLAMLIPIFALSIPIVAIIANAVTKKYKGVAPREIADLQQYASSLEKRVGELEETVRTLTDDVGRIETEQRFLSRLLEDKSKE